MDFCLCRLTFDGETHPWRAEMSEFVIAFIAMPLAVVAVGYVAMRLNERAVKHEKHHPAE